jgi:exosortase A-associated hydrolase 2
VLFLPPFAEEMNRSRRLAAIQARALAAEGAGVLILDLFGTGDSAGDFAEARWEIWQEDAETALAWMQQHGYRRVTFLGLRLGACLALEVATRAADRVDHVVLWQPILRGHAFLSQFLRIRLAGSFDERADMRETPTRLRDRLSAGETLEVAGYPLSPALASAIDRLHLADLGEKCPAPIDWFELSAKPGVSCSPASWAVIQRWQEAGKAVSAMSLRGEPFWSIEETVIVPELVKRTAEQIVNFGHERATGSPPDLHL